jgi:hypothetical protein
VVYVSIDAVYLRGTSCPQCLDTTITKASYHSQSFLVTDILQPHLDDSVGHQNKMAPQRALLVQEIGKPLVLVHDRPIPEPGRGQLLIKVTVAGKSYTCSSRSHSDIRLGNNVY